MHRPVKIEFNGQTYDGIDQMPPDVREEYLRLIAPFGDANRNGIPDALENGFRGAATQTLVEERIVINGKEYRSLDEVPPDLRPIVERLRPNAPAPSVVVSSETKVIEIGSDRPRARGAGQGIPAGARWLIAVLAGALATILFFWLTGVRPSDLWK